MQQKLQGNANELDKNTTTSYLFQFVTFWDSHCGCQGSLTDIHIITYVVEIGVKVAVLLTVTTSRNVDRRYGGVLTTSDESKTNSEVDYHRSHNGQNDKEILHQSKYVATKSKVAAAFG